MCTWKHIKTSWNFMKHHPLLSPKRATMTTFKPWESSFLASSSSKSLVKLHSFRTIWGWTKTIHNQLIKCNLWICLNGVNIHSAAIWAIVWSGHQGFDMFWPIAILPFYQHASIASIFALPMPEEPPEGIGPFVDSSRLGYVVWKTGYPKSWWSWFIHDFPCKYC